MSVTRYVKTKTFGLLLRCLVSLETTEITIAARDRQTRATIPYWDGEIYLGDALVGIVGADGVEVDKEGFTFIQGLAKHRATEMIDDVIAALQVHAVPFQRDKAIARYDRQLLKEDQASADRAIGAEIMAKLNDRRVTVSDTAIVSVSSNGNGKVPVAAK